MIRPLVAVLVAALLLDAAPARAAETPPAIARTMAATLKAKSFHVEVTTESATMQMDVVRPNTFRIIAPKGVAMVHTDAGLWVKHGGQWSKMPDMLSGTMTMLFTEVMKNPEAYAKLPEGEKLEDAGSDTLDGKPMHKWRLAKSESHAQPVMLWIGATDDRLYRVDAISEHTGKATIRYSKYDQVPPIVAPA